ncbi:MAG: PQQ-binding-like beta-propeller repeat protein, partial [Betaproteobacteria bacterium]|nr:PQQ-binding-like beta-propeller repeat protein [Betaproteobacteria bacterium]
MNRIALVLVGSALLGGCSGSADFGDDFDREWVDGNIEQVWEADIGSSGWGLGLSLGEDSVCTVSSDAQIYVLALADGQKLQSQFLDFDESVAAATCDGQRAFIVLDDASALLQAIGEDAERWQVNLGRSLLGEPLFAGENIIVFGADGTIEAWSANSGLLLWEHTQQVSGIRLEGFFRPLQVQDNVYAGLPSGDLLAIAAETG